MHETFARKDKPDDGAIQCFGVNRAASSKSRHRFGYRGVGFFPRSGACTGGLKQEEGPQKPTLGVSDPLGKIGCIEVRQGIERVQLAAFRVEEQLSNGAVPDPEVQFNCGLGGYAKDVTDRR